MTRSAIIFASWSHVKYFKKSVYDRRDWCLYVILSAWNSEYFQFLSRIPVSSNDVNQGKSYNNSGIYRLIEEEGRRVPHVWKPGREESTLDQVVELLLNIFLFPETNQEFVIQEKAHIKIFSSIFLCQQLVSWLFPVFMWTANRSFLADSITSDQTQSFNQFLLCACVDTLKREYKNADAIIYRMTTVLSEK